MLTPTDAVLIFMMIQVRVVKWRDANQDKVKVIIRLSA